MISAKEARELASYSSKATFDKALKEVGDKINHAAIQGKVAVTYFGRLQIEVLDHLRELGYNVIFNPVPTGRPGEEPSYTIRWN